MKKTLLVLFGGASSEHEVSLQSAASVLDNINADNYNILKIGITKQGIWHLFYGDTSQLRDGTWINNIKNEQAILSPDQVDKGIIVKKEHGYETIHIDVVFPVLHGKNGEDGTIQGLLELAGIPYVGCDVLSSAMCLDKSITNAVLEVNNVPKTPWCSARIQEINQDAQFISNLSTKLRYPIFVKPANAGSSIGITKVKSENEMQNAILVAAEHDSKIVFEQGVEDAYEVECAVLGNYENIFASVIGEIEPCNEIYDYEAKYQSGDKSTLHIPARLSEEKQEELKQVSIKAYKAMCCTGLARVDSFVEKKTGNIILNEINTLPGFTDISMYGKLMQASGISYADLIDRLIDLAFERAAI